VTWGGETEEDSVDSVERGPVHLTAIHLHLPANEPPSIRRRNSHGTDRGERERERARESARASELVTEAGEAEGEGDRQRRDTEKEGTQGETHTYTLSHKLSLCETETE
jgi:hypothetical protein